MESSRYGMSGILMSMTELNGETLTFNQAMSILGQRKGKDKTVNKSLTVLKMKHGRAGAGIGQPTHLMAVLQAKGI